MVRAGLLGTAGTAEESARAASLSSPLAGGLWVLAGGPALAPPAALGHQFWLAGHVVLLRILPAPVCLAYPSRGTPDPRPGDDRRPRSLYRIGVGEGLRVNRVHDGEHRPHAVPVARSDPSQRSGRILRGGVRDGIQRRLHGEDAPLRRSPGVRLASACSLVAMLGGVLLYGHLRRAAAPESEPAARIVLIQGSIDVQFKADPTMADRIHEHYRGLTLDAVREAARNGRSIDLVVWPETMFRNPIIQYPASLATRINPDFREESQETRREMAALARQSRASLLLGVDTEEVINDTLKFHNSAAFVPRTFDPEAGANPARYDKIHLVMFGEYVPLADYLPWLQHLTPLPFSQTPGEMPAAFDLKTPQGGSLRIAPNICYESVLPQEIRWQFNRLTAEGREPDVLVNITNDGWFWGSSELDMHLACGVFRAIECRKPFLIAANTGFSAWIDADGCIRQQGPHRATGFILADVCRDGRQSLYLTCGDWPAAICLAACVLFAAAGYWKSRRGKTGR